MEELRGFNIVPDATADKNSVRFFFMTSSFTDFKLFLSLIYQNRVEIVIKYKKNEEKGDNNGKRKNIARVSWHETKRGWISQTLF
jgi:hypothetical protein